MLILSRKVGESIKIGDGVTVTVLGKRGTQIRLGITAPEGVKVNREEIYLSIGESESANAKTEAAQDQ